MKFVAAFLAGYEQFAEITVDTLVAEEVGDELHGGGHEVTAFGAVNGKGASAVFEPGRFDEGGKVAAVIDVKVAEENDVEAGHLRAAFTEAQSAAAAGVYKDARLAVLPDEIAAGSAFVLEFGAAGAQDL